MPHFYDSDGKLHTHVPYADPTRGMREATLADARKAGWGPSVTGVLGDLSKAGLDNWKIEQAIKVALPMAAQAAEPEIMAEVKRQADAYRDWSAEFGTAVHHFVSAGIKIRTEAEWKGRPEFWPEMLGAQEVAQAFLSWMGPNGVQVTESELSFSSSLGYGGTIDLLGTYYGEPFIGDLKTQDWGAEGDKNKRANWYDPEWPLQLAGYAIGHRLPYYEHEPDLLRLSFVLSRTRPGLIEVKQWLEPERYDQAWIHLWEHWQATHKWGKWAKGTDLTLLQGGLGLEG